MNILTTQGQLPMIAIPSMNDMHLEEMIIIDKLDTAIANSDVDAISKLIDELLEHSTIHFANEEAIMQETQYPDYQAHKSEHDRHLQELGSLVKYFERTREPKAIYAYSKGNLTPWRIHHIETMDTMMALHHNS